ELGWSWLGLIRVDLQRCGFRLGALFCRAVMKIGMTQYISASFTSSHSTSSGDASPTYGQVGITQSWTLAKGRHGGKLVRHRHKEVFLEWGRLPCALLHVL